MLQRGYTRAVPATQIGQNLAFINWTVLTGLALGSYAAVVLLRRRTSATPGYLRFTAICALGFGVLAWISDGALPASSANSPVVVDPAWDAPRRAALGLFTVLVAVGLVVRPGGAAGPRRRRGRGLAAATADPRLRGPGVGRRVARGGRAAGPAGGRQRGHRRRLRGDDPRPLVSRDAEAARGAAHPARAGPARRRRGPGRAVRGLDGDRRRTGRRRAVLVARRAVGAVRLAAPDRRADLPARRLLGVGPDRAVAVDGIGDRACCTSTSARSRPGRSWPRVSISVPDCSCEEETMGKNDRSWIPDTIDLDWIESLARPLPPALAAIEAAAGPARHPDRRPRHRPGPVGPRRRPAADRRGRDGLRLLDAVAGARPAGRRHDRDDRSGPRADGPRPRLVAPGAASPTSGSRSSTRPPSRRSRRGAIRRSPARSTSSSSTRSSPSTRPTSRRSSAGSRPARWSSPTTSCGAAASPAPGRSRPTTRTPRRCARSTPRSSPIRASRRRSCRSATACSSPRGAAEPGAGRRPCASASGSACSRSSASWPGRARSTLELADGCGRRGRLGRARRPRTRSWRPAGRRCASPATATTRTRRRSLADGDEVAMIPPVSGGDAPDRPGSSRSARRRSATTILAELADAPRHCPRTARSSGSSAGPGRRPARRRRARRPRPRDTPAERSRRSSTRRSSRWPSRRSATIADEIESALRGRSGRHRPSDRRGPARRGVHRGRRRRAPSRRGVRGRALRDRRDQGPRPDLEGRAVRRRPRLDRPPGTERDRRRRDEGLHQRRHGGHRRGQPPASDERRPRPLPGRGRADDRRDQRRDRGRPARRRRRRPGQRQPRRDVQPAARPDPPGRARAAGPEGVVDGRGRRTGAGRTAFDVALFVGYHARAGHAARDDRPHLLRRRRSRRAWTAGRPASTA